MVRHVLSSVSTKVLDGTDLSAVQALLDRDPVTNVFVASRVRLAGVDPWRLGGELWGYYEGGLLTSLCYAGANLVPVEAGPDAIRSFAERARRQGRRCSSIVGPAEAAAGLWRLLEPAWGPARDVRPVQPLMVAGRPSAEVPADPLVRRVRPDELDLVMPACVSMFTEEVGVSPLVGDGGTLYRARVSELIAGGRAFARIEDGRVVFKAEIGAVTRHACQIQGVWVAPERRGEGLSEIGMAAVLRHALAEVAPVASLYVNSYNGPARAAYRRVGFAETGAFMSVLF
ncbi:GNAT family N-acetyltransferase [Embleya sp. MST-111070]|uniref:GNAT family N-acetyltransferase n=1 Tax=Embleya sp. MST-111070 TaxID=3398231 RepID=UPI003F741C8A